MCYGASSQGAPEHREALNEECNTPRLVLVAGERANHAEFARCVQQAFAHLLLLFFVWR